MGEVIRPWEFLRPSYLRWKRENHRMKLEERERDLERRKELRTLAAERAFRRTARDLGLTDTTSELPAPGEGSAR